MDCMCDDICRANDQTQQRQVQFKKKTKLMRKIITVLTTTLLAAGLAGAATTVAWTDVLDERFETNPNGRITLMPERRPGQTSSGAHDKAQSTYSLQGYISLIRPAQAGAHASLGVEASFAMHETNASSATKSAFLLTLVDKSMVGFEILLPPTRHAPALVSIVYRRPGEGKFQSLREFRLEGGEANGRWQLDYRHGLLSLSHGSNLLGRAEAPARLGVQVAGVVWWQRGGRATCRQLTLSGEPRNKYTPQQIAIAKRAASLNREATRLFFKDKKSAEALVKMREASDLFVEAHGQNHHDVANSFANLASILGAMGRQNEAETLLMKAVTINEAMLGSTHPHSIRTRVQLARHFLECGKREQARAIAHQCRDEWQETLGADKGIPYSLSKLLHEL